MLLCVIRSDKDVLFNQGARPFKLVLILTFFFNSSCRFSSATCCCGSRPRCFDCSWFRTTSSSRISWQGSHGLHSRWMVINTSPATTKAIASLKSRLVLGSNCSTLKQVSLDHTSSALVWLHTCAPRKSTSWSTNITPVFPFFSWSSTPPRSWAHKWLLT